MPDITNYDGRLEQMAYYCEAMLDNIAKVNNAYHDSVADAYTATLPDNLIKWKGIKRIGGKTILRNQEAQELSNTTCALWDATYSSASYSDGTVTVSTIDNSTSSTYLYGIQCGKHGLKRISGHVYFASVEILSSAARDYRFDFSDEAIVATYSAPAEEWATISTVYTSNRNNNVFCSVFPKTVPSVGDSYKLRNLMFIDLTLMFGAGNEPSTVAEFKARCPADYYSYSIATLFSAGVTSALSKDSNNTILQAYSIPAEVQELTGYGWSCPNHYNYIDYKAKKFVQEVGSRSYEAGDESDATVITDGTNTYYALSHTVETDISAYLTDENIVEVESSGTITFPNQHGDDYLIPVPVKIEYIGVA